MSVEGTREIDPTDAVLDSPAGEEAERNSDSEAALLHGSHTCDGPGIRRTKASATDGRSRSVSGSGGQLIRELLLDCNPK